MLIHFSLTPIELEGVDKTTLREATALLLSAHRRGDHVTVVPRDTALWLTHNLQLSEQDIATANRIKSEYTQNAGLLNQAQVFLKIVADADHLRGDSDREIPITLNTFAKTRLSERVAFVVEDIVNDGKTYESILAGIGKRHAARVTAFELLHGGGDRIEETFKKQIEYGRFVVCIVDSDFPAPSDGIPTKAKRLRQIANRENWRAQIIAITPCREIENFIPLEIIRELGLNIDNETIRNLGRIAEREKPSHKTDKYWLYFDIKEGADGERLKRISGEAERKWIEELT